MVPPPGDATYRDATHASPRNEHAVPEEELSVRAKESEKNGEKRTSFLSGTTQHLRVRRSIMFAYPCTPMHDSKERSKVISMAPRKRV